MQLSLAQAARWMPGGSIVGDPGVLADRVHTDTRSLAHGDLFFALRGERFDAQAFLPQAKAAGAAAAVAQGGLADAGIPGIEVADARRALGELAAGWRAQFTLPLIAVAGSNGKTTVTQMVASILRSWLGEHAFATEGNFNNDVGLPLTLLRLRASHRAGVVELGMNHPGEIAWLADIARPTVALVNNAQREHLEFMASVEAVARENGAVIERLPSEGVAVIPAADAFAGLWRALAGNRRLLTFGLMSDGVSDVRGEGVWSGGEWTVHAQSPAGPLQWRLQVAGLHNVRNSLAAAACAIAAGAPVAAIADGLGAFRAVKGRSRALQLRIGGRDVTLVDDSYNANPDSVRAAIDVLAALPAPRLLVLGDMGEVGERGPEFHAEAGEHARAAGIEQLFTVGELSVAAQGRHFADRAALDAAITAELPRMASVLVKGSRFMAMERVVAAIVAQTQQEEGTHAA